MAGRIDAVFTSTKTLTPVHAPIDCNGNGDNVIIAAVAGYSIVVLSYNFMVAGAVNAKFTNGPAGTEFMGALPLQANEAYGVAASDYGHFATSSGTSLVLNLSAGVQASGHLTYVLKPS